jgi:hypothetical protein
MEAFLATLAGLGINIVATGAARLGLPTKHVVLLMAILIGAAYTTFTMYVPSEVQSGIQSFVGIALSTSWVVWEYVLPMLGLKK